MIGEGKESSMYNDTMKVGIESQLVKGRKGFKVNTIKTIEGNVVCAMIQSQLVKRRKGFKVNTIKTSEGNVICAMI